MRACIQLFTNTCEMHDVGKAWHSYRETITQTTNILNTSACVESTHYLAWFLVCYFNCNNNNTTRLQFLYNVKYLCCKYATFLLARIRSVAFRSAFYRGSEETLWKRTIIILYKKFNYRIYTVRNTMIRKSKYDVEYTINTLHYQ